MLNPKISADTVWPKLLQRVYAGGSDVRPRGLLCREVLSQTSTIDMLMPITTVRPKLGYRFMVAEAHWVITGRNDVASIQQYSPHISSFSNDGIRFDGAYGPRIIDQLRFVCDALEDDPQSRQAVIEIWRPNPRPSKDLPCTVALQWMIREREGLNELHCFDTMRSSDTWLGWPYDVFTFSSLSAYIALMLRDRAKKTFNSSLICLNLGNLYLTAASQHLYLQPKMDGATNIPYSAKDIEEVLADPLKPKQYAPLNLDEFTCAEDFLYHLKVSKDLVGNRSWMAEFQGAAAA